VLLNSYGTSTTTTRRTVVGQLVTIALVRRLVTALMKSTDYLRQLTLNRLPGCNDPAPGKASPTTEIKAQRNVRIRSQLASQRSAWSQTHVDPSRRRPAGTEPTNRGTGTGAQTPDVIQGANVPCIRRRQASTASQIRANGNIVVVGDVSPVIQPCTNRPFSTQADTRKGTCAYADRLGCPGRDQAHRCCFQQPSLCRQGS